MKKNLRCKIFGHKFGIPFVGGTTFRPNEMPPRDKYWNGNVKNPLMGFLFAECSRCGETHKVNEIWLDNPATLHRLRELYYVIPRHDMNNHEKKNMVEKTYKELITKFERDAYRGSSKPVRLERELED